ncbi:DUF6907 domain-containing protein, partial [Mycobacterium marinum]
TAPNVPLPPGAEYADPWGAVDSDPRQYRVINGATRSVEGNSDVEVWTAAVQYDDGTLDQDALDRPNVWIQAHQEGLSSAQARELAAALLSAADELDGWTRR